MSEKETTAELLEAGRELLDLWDTCGECDNDDDLVDFVINNFDCADTARAVITRVEGEQE